MEAAHQQDSRGYMPPAQKVEWGSPPALVAALAAELGSFDLDPAASDELHVAPAFFTVETDGLARPWRGRVFLNPPYGRGIGRWLEKARDEVTAGRAELVCCLVPANTSSGWWHDLVLAGHVALTVEVRYLRGRLRFVGAKYDAPFGSAVVIYRKAPEGRMEASS